MNKTKKLITGIVLSLSTGVLSACGDDLPPQPDEDSCSEWDWDDELGVWECDDSHSHYHGHYFYGGIFYKSRSDFKKSSAYKAYKSSSSFKGGIGSGSKGGFGG